MTDLSPAALAVLDAFEAVPLAKTRRFHIAAALRAAAQQLQQAKGWSLGVRWSAQEILTIANELEAQ